MSISGIFQKLFANKKRVCGIELDKNILRYCIREGKREVISNMSFCSYKLSDILINDGEINKKDELKELLLNFKAEQNITDEPVVTTINSRKAVSRYLEMPAMSEKDLKKAVMYEAEQYLPYAAEEAQVDCALLGATSRDSNKTGVLLAAAPKELVMSYYNLFHEVSLNLTAIDIKPMVFKRWFLYLGEETHADFYHTNICLINLGSEVIDLIIFQKGSPLFSRSFSVDSSLFLSNQETGNSEVSEENLTEEAYNKLEEEIKNTIEYSKAQIPPEPLARFILTGPFSKVSEIENIIKNNFSLPVEVEDLYLSNLDLEVPLETAVTAGLSLRDV